MSEITTQPKMIGGRVLGKPIYTNGGKRSVARLKYLGYDPIGELVTKYKELESELDRQKRIRNNEIVELTASGRPRSFNPETMMSIFDKQIAIAEKLLRYGYGRVPETNVDEAKPAMPLVVNLTKKGDTYVANDTTDEGDDFTYEDEDADTHE